MTKFRRQKRNGIAISASVTAWFLILLATSWCFIALYHMPSSMKMRYINPKWAYVFLLADVDPAEPSYQGILYNIFVSTYVLKHDPTAQSHSKADIVVMVQMSPSSKESRLREEPFLERMG